MTTHFTELAHRAAADGVVSPEELLGLRRQGWGDGIITREEAEALFAINNVLSDRDPAWCDFFVEAIGEYVLNAAQPRLQCSPEEAEWLIAQVDHDGVVESMVELETLVRIVERAENVPDALKNYVLGQIENEVLTGTGPTRCGGELSSVHISEAEVKILRRVIFSSGGYGPAAVSRFDAELLLRLKNATLANDNDPSWGDLFVDGITNHLRGFSLDNAQLSHERKLELIRTIEDNSANIGRFFSQMAKSDASLPTRIRWLAEHLAGTDGPQNDYSGDADAGHAVTAAEKDWLDVALDDDGQIDALEKRLLRRLADDELI
ncbi:hypothetical protein FGU71_05245 [Erythrobacter insulae]|uniref:Uncharacterized protein n=1 Tax=Erythrobacter insulae TaxID=2584124 RepID=A0A547PB00_9SPHN|nr:hypothetical protein [Erythrobacter insulae]TRD11310.1 hypothetical protein FGU71_05245 [Erythrobacter insulae]